MIKGTQKIRLSQIKSTLPDFVDFEKQLISMFGEDTIEKFVAYEGQTTFTLKDEYAIGKDSIKVFVNGVLQSNGETPHYIEINSKMIGFSYPLSKDDIVVIIRDKFKKHSLDMGREAVKAYDIYRNTNLVKDVNQLNFYTDKNYEVGLNQLKVYANGLLLTPGPGFNYTEVSENQFMLHDKMPENTTITYEIISGGLNVYKCDRYPFFIDDDRSKQLEYNLLKKYKPNSNNLKVYLNGILLRKGEDNDYIEVDETTFKMNYNLPIGSILEAEIITFTVDVFTIMREEYEITEQNKNKLNYTTKAPFTMGESNLRVYLNGILLREGINEDYVEVDNNNFKFNYELYPGSTIEYEIIFW